MWNLRVFYFQSAFKFLLGLSKIDVFSEIFKYIELSPSHTATLKQTEETEFLPEQ